MTEKNLTIRTTNSNLDSETLTLGISYRVCCPLPLYSLGWALKGIARSFTSPYWVHTTDSTVEKPKWILLVSPIYPQLSHTPKIKALPIASLRLPSFPQAVSFLELLKTVFLEPDGVDVDEATGVNGTEVDQRIHRRLLLRVQLRRLGWSAHDVAIAPVAAEVHLAVLWKISTAMSKCGKYIDTYHCLLGEDQAVFYEFPFGWETENWWLDGQISSDLKVKLARILRIKSLTTHGSRIDLEETGPCHPWQGPQCLSVLIAAIKIN